MKDSQKIYVLYGKNGRNNENKNCINSTRSHTLKAHKSDRAFPNYRYYYRINPVWLFMRDRISQTSPFLSCRLVTLTLGCLAFGSNDAIEAQIVPDNTVGSQVERVNAKRDRITGGTTRGSNLFHSFREFSISEGRAAYFANPAAIQTIFSRVTGNNPSQIFGTLGVEGNANLFFINPNGIIFGPNARLDVRGSFIGSTANSIAFPNGENFSATNPNAPPLLTIDVPVPIGLVFESDNTGVILNGANLETRQNLALIGASILSSGRISAPGQDIALATVPAGVNSVVRLEGTGEYIRQTPGSGQLNFENRDILLTGGTINAGSTGTSGDIILDSAGDVLLSNEAVVDVRGGGGGNITVNARNLEINRSDILAGIASGLGSPNAQAGNININVAETVKLQGGDSRFYNLIGNLVNSGGLGNTGNININTNMLEGSGAFQISSSTFGRGNAGRVNIKAKDAISLEGAEDFLSGIFSSVQASGNGEAGGIEIETGSLSLSNGAILLTSTLGQGNAGNIQIAANESVFLNGGAYLEANTAGRGNAGNITIEAEKGTVSLEGANTSATAFVNSSARGNGGNLKITADVVSLSNEAFLSTGTSSTGDAGDTNITTRQLLLRDGARITTFAGSESEGNAGNLTINATESVWLIGASADSSSFLSTRTSGKGDAGDINIATRQLLVRDGAEITTSARSESEGNAGNLTINATESVQLIGSSADGELSNLFTSTFGKGNAGDLNITTSQLLVRDGAFISTGVGEGSEGDAGKLTINATGSVQLIGASAESPSGLTTRTSGKGNAGDVNITTRQLLVRDGAIIFTTASGEGDAGTLTINATESIQLIGASDAGFSYLSASTSGKGNAGDVNIATRQLLVRDGAYIFTTTRGEGDAGTLTIKATESIQLIDALDDNFSTGLSTFTSGKGNAGDINIATRQLLVRDGATITTFAQGEGNAGNLTIDATELIQLIGSSAESPSGLSTSAFGQGNAGKLTLTTSQLLIRDGANATTLASGKGNAGDLIVNATESVEIFGSSADGRSSGLSTSTLGTGNAGDLTLTTKQLLLQDGGAIFTSTGGEGNAGKLTINATESVQAIGTSADDIPSGFTTQTAGKGKAGDLILTTRQLSLQDGARISTRTQGEGKGGILTINASESIELSGVRASDSSPTRITSEARGAGDAGILNIFTGNLLVEDGAAITVNSQGSGIGGQIFLEADSLTLNNSTIFAETASTDGGDVILDVQDLLLLRNGAQISTTAGTAQAGGKGGDIIIDAGSIVAIPDENSDITANAFEGDGGGVLINTQSIFGIDFRSQLTPLSDITASSERGAAGEVIINTSGVEPTRGVEALTEQRINVEVAQGCQVGGTASGSISFYNVGRGGLPPSPDDLLNSPATQEWLSLESQESSSQPKVEPSFSRQQDNIIASQLIFSCQAR
ncbi:MAG: filamentous hemagglutinin N-terminal domain-containing protein [Hydrococcus sp. Prado102]|nr:filamentous hemagglutinin N-terminal domain-containing protein [Hydrococcus sp. Prado102]